MSEILELAQMIDQGTSSSASWFDAESLDYDDIMSSLNASQDYTDLNDLLDVGNASDVIHVPAHDSSCLCDNDDYTETKHWCPEHAKLRQEIYESQIENENKRLVQENEAGLMEALKQSMEDQFECGALSDFFASNYNFQSDPVSYMNENALSTNENILEQTEISITNMETTFPSSVTSPSEEASSPLSDAVLIHPDDSKNVSDNDSMLKQLLLNPNDNYPKEIDSNNTSVQQVSEQVLPKTLCNSGDSLDEKKPVRKMKKKKKIAKKPFTELLKHFETPKTPKLKDMMRPKTHLVNVNRYMRQYGSAPPSRVASPVSDAGVKLEKKASVLKTISLQPVASTTNNAKAVLTTVAASGKNSHLTKVYSIATPSASAIKTRANLESEKMIVAPDANSLLDMFEVERSNNFNLNSDCDGKVFTPTADKRRGTVLIDPLPKKRQKVNEDGKKFILPAGETQGQPCTERPYAEHDYCQQNSSGSQSTSADVLSAVIQASGLIEKQSSDGQFEVPVSRPPSSNKVLKWEEYLQRVRLGTRSAPNSPTTSPKIVRGSARTVNNFMVGASPGVVTQKSSKQASPLLDPIAAIKTQSKPQNPMKLQEFQEYLAKLQSNQEAKVGLSNSLVGVTLSANNGKGTIKVSQATAAGPTLPITVSAGQHAVQHARPILPQPFIKIHSGGKIHTAAVTSSHTTIPGSKPVVMIRLPAANEPTTVVGLPCVTTTQTQPAAATIMTAVPAQIFSANGQPITSQQSTSVSVNELVKDPRVLVKKPKPLTTVLKPISREKWNSKKPASKTSGINKPVISTINAKASSPTFKLVTSGKGGVASKALLLSGVSGQLEEILTLLAKQQQQGKVIEHKEAFNVQQQKTLEQLLAAITNLKSKPSDGNPQSTPVTVVPSCSITNTSVVKTASHNKLTLNPVKKNLSVPSPLSLIHEIKQNMNKASEAPKTQPSHHKPRYIYTVPATSSSSKLRSRSKSALETANVYPVEKLNTTTTSRVSVTPVETKPIATPVVQSASLVSPIRPVASPNTPDVEYHEVSYPLRTVLPKNNVETKETPTSNDLYQSVFVDRHVASVQNSDTVNAGVVSSPIPVIINQKPTTIIQEKYADEFIELIVKSTLDEICDKVSEIQPRIFENQSSNSHISCSIEGNERLPSFSEKSILILRPHEVHRNMLDSSLPAVGAVMSHKPEHIAMCRSMAAAEMMADDIVEKNREELLVYSYQQPKVSTVSLSKPEEGELAETAGDDSQYYNKLPAYMYSGKMFAAEEGNCVQYPVHEEVSGYHTNTSGLKELSTDPLVSNDGCTLEYDIQYNKLPHYLSSGKLGPSESDDLALSASGEVAHEVVIGSSKQSRGLGFTTKLKCTPEGNVIDTDETFYSRLPSYYSYGRTHVVDTVTEPPDEPDDIVTEETLEKQHEERKSRRERRKRKKKKRKKRQRSERRSHGDKILYSKLPSYLVSGRKTLSAERGASEHSYSSSFSLSSDFDRDSRSRSPIRRRRSYRRTPTPRRDRSFSYSSSRSRSNSPRRTWRRERCSYRSDNCSSSQRYDRGGYSSESDYSTSRRRRRRRRSSSDDSEWNYQQRKRQEQDQEERQEKERAIQQRRVMYVGGISDTTTKIQLRDRFSKFGEIDNVALHFRTGRDSYAFVTFRFSCDATLAIEHGNKGDVFPTYVLCYGGRRQFCQVDYADLDDGCEGNKRKDNDDELDFDALLKQAMQRT